MRVKAYFTGTISDDPKIVTVAGKKPFLAFSVESPDHFNKWPNRLRCAVYGNDLESVRSSLSKGVIITVDGEISAEGYINQTTGKPAASQKLFVKTMEIFGNGGGGQDSAQPRSAPPRPNSASATTAPAAEAEDDVPF